MYIWCITAVLFGSCSGDQYCGAGLSLPLKSHEDDSAILPECRVLHSLLAVTQVPYPCLSRVKAEIHFLLIKVRASLYADFGITVFRGFEQVGPDDPWGPCQPGISWLKQSLKLFVWMESYWSTDSFFLSYAIKCKTWVINLYIADRTMRGADMVVLDYWNLISCCNWWKRHVQKEK